MPDAAAVASQQDKIKEEQLAAHIKHLVDVRAHKQEEYAPEIAAARKELQQRKNKWDLAWKQSQPADVQLAEALKAAKRKKTDLDNCEAELQSLH